LSKCTLIEQVCIVGENLPQTIALIVLSADAKALDKAEVEEKLVEAIKDVNKSLDKHEKMKKAVIMQEEWTIENNLMTPTLKVKRNILEKQKKDFYAKWYNEGGNIVWE
jgi:long-chain acyl-CoA synthetase